MKHKVLTYAFIPAVFGFGLLAVNIASAHGMFGGFNTLAPDEIALRQQTMFQNEAQILGITVDEVKTAWAEGKTFAQIAQDKGITQEQLQTRLKDAQNAQMKTHLQTLVDKGIITQAQADQRLQVMQNRLQNGNGHMGRRMNRGFNF